PLPAGPSGTAARKAEYAAAPARAGRRAPHICMWSAGSFMPPDHTGFSCPEKAISTIDSVLITTAAWVIFAVLRIILICVFYIKGSFHYGDGARANPRLSGTDTRLHPRGDQHAVS